MPKLGFTDEMNKIIQAYSALIFIVLVFVGSVFAQNPVSWTLESDEKGKELKSNSTFKVKLKAAIEGDWHLYSTEQPEGGPIATKITVDEPFKINGKIETPQPITKFDNNFQIETKIFEKQAEFAFPVKISADSKADDFSAAVRFQVCNETTCLPPKTVKVGFSGVIEAKKPTAAKSETPKFVPEKPQDVSVWTFLWLAISFGALSLLTPCVFPMIPITVSYFTNHASGDRTKALKLAAVYSGGIIATFTLLGMAIAILLGASGINLFAANPWVNIVITAIFLFFAFNLFGLYEIAVPSSLLTKLDGLTRSKEGDGSAYIGALLMGLTFTLTSFTCTSPFVGTILVSTAQGDWQMPLLGMLAFSTVFALPFFVLALAPQLVSQLPRSGGWLNSVKVAMGFLEIAAAMKFLSNVDLVWRWGIFTREVVLTIWVIVGIALALYILGLFKFKLDSPVKKITPLRIILSIVCIGMSIYLVTGILGKKLGELESFLPPKNPESKLNILGDKNEELTWVSNDFEKAKQQAKAENKLIFVDFTGYTCTNCRWMEANMFPRPTVRGEMSKFVLSRLYTDGEGEMFENQQKFEQDTFGTVALPYYAIFDADGNPIATFPGLTRTEQDFLDFMKKAQSR